MKIEWEKRGIKLEQLIRARRKKKWIAAHQRILNCTNCAHNTQHASYSLEYWMHGISALAAVYTVFLREFIDWFGEEVDVEWDCTCPSTLSIWLRPIRYIIYISSASRSVVKWRENCLHRIGQFRPNPWQYNLYSFHVSYKDILNFPCFWIYWFSHRSNILKYKT